MVWTCSESGRGETAKKSYEVDTTRKKKRRKTYSYLGGKD
jgi:hypothetical protein